MRRNLDALPVAQGGLDLVSPAPEGEVERSKPTSGRGEMLAHAYRDDAPYNSMARLALFQPGELLNGGPSSGSGLSPRFVLRVAVSPAPLSTHV